MRIMWNVSMEIILVIYIYLFNELARYLLSTAGGSMHRAMKVSTADYNSTSSNAFQWTDVSGQTYSSFIEWKNFIEDVTLHTSSFYTYSYSKRVILYLYYKLYYTYYSHTRSYRGVRIVRFLSVSGHSSQRSFLIYRSEAVSRWHKCSSSVDGNDNEQQSNCRADIETDAKAASCNLYSSEKILILVSDYSNFIIKSQERQNLPSYFFLIYYTCEESSEFPRATIPSLLNRNNFDFVSSTVLRCQDYSTGTYFFPIKTKLLRRTHKIYYYVVLCLR